jgi:hypothetical protein
MLSRDSDIVGIKYFTARVTGRPGNAHAGQRQQTYFRALATVPKLTIHYGHFITRTATRRCVKDRRGKPAFVDVWVTEEKGSDVNLASHMLIDAFRARYDLAVVVSNDGDLKEPVHFVRHELKTPVGVLNPHGNRSYALSPRQLPRGSFYKPIRRAALRASQFPSTVPVEGAGREGDRPQATGVVAPENRNGRPEAAAHPAAEADRGVRCMISATAAARQDSQRSAHSGGVPILVPDVWIAADEALRLLWVSRPGPI